MAESATHLRAKTEARVRWILYVVGPILSYLTTFAWLKPGALLGRGDIFPYIFLNPSGWNERLWSLWDNKLNLGAPADYAKNATLYLFSSVIHLFGNGVTAQHVYYGAIVALQFAAMAWLVRTIRPSEPGAAFAAATFYCFNVAMFQVLPYPMFMFFLAYTPFMVVLLLRSLDKSASLALRIAFVVASSLSGMLFQNPPTFLLFAVVMAGIALFGVLRASASRRVIVRRLAAMVVGILVVNAYWLAPSGMALFGAGHEQVSAITGDEWLGFVSRRSSLLNVFWLEPYWAWGFPIYYPFARGYENPWIIVCTFLPATFFFSSIVTARDKLNSFLVGIALVLMLLTTGVHEPFGLVNDFLYKHMPLYWLYREPTTKFPLILIGVMAPVIGFQIASFARFCGSMIRFRANVSRFAVGFLVLFLTCVPAYPVLTGLLEGQRNYDGIKLISNEVRVPAYWNDLSSYLQRNGASDRVLMLPNDDFYAMSYRWNLYAADPDILGELVANPFVLATQADAVSYLRSSGLYPQFQEAFYESIVDRVRHSLWPFIAIQGVRYVVERGDVLSSAPGRTLLSPTAVASFIADTPELEFVRSFGPLTLYRVNERVFLPPLYLTPRHDVAAQRVFGFDDTSAQRVTVHQATPSRMEVWVRDAHAGDAIVYAELFNPSWTACIVEARAADGCRPLTIHGRAYGFENFWRLPVGGSYDVRISYAPQSIGDGVRWLSLVGLIGLVGVLCFIEGRRVYVLRRPDREEGT